MGVPGFHLLGATDKGGTGGGRFCPFCPFWPRRIFVYWGRRIRAETGGARFCPFCPLWPFWRITCGGCRGGGVGLWCGARGSVGAHGERTRRGSGVLYSIPGGGLQPGNWNHFGTAMFGGVRLDSARRSLAREGQFSARMAAEVGGPKELFRQKVGRQINLFHVVNRMVSWISLGMRRSGAPRELLEINLNGMSRWARMPPRALRHLQAVTAAMSTLVLMARSPMLPRK